MLPEVDPSLLTSRRSMDFSEDNAQESTFAPVLRKGR